MIYTCVCAYIFMCMCMCACPCMCDIWCGLAGSLIPVRLWVFTYVTWVIIATRAGDAGTVCAAVSRARRLGP